MRQTLVIAAAVAALASTFPAAVHAEESCATGGTPMSKAAIEKSLTDRGYTQIRSLSRHNGCYEAKGLDSKGKRFELELDASTGAIRTTE